MSDQKRKIAFYKRSKKPWTEEEYRNIIEYVGDNDYEFDWCKDDYYLDNNRKYIFDDGDDETFMHFWVDQEQNSNFPNCQKIAYEDVFGNNHSQECTPEIPEGTIVMASCKDDNIPWKAKYFGKCRDKHIITNFNGKRISMVDHVKVIPTMTKAEAKQRVSELFVDKRKVTSHMIRDIIDLIEEQ